MSCTCVRLCLRMQLGPSIRSFLSRLSTFLLKPFSHDNPQRNGMEHFGFFASGKVISADITRLPLIRELERTSICLCSTFDSWVFGNDIIETEFQVVTILIFAWVSDKYHQRAAVIAVQTVITIVGMTLTGYAASPGWRYAGKLLSKRERICWHLRQAFFWAALGLVVAFRV